MGVTTDPVAGSGSDPAWIALVEKPLLVQSLTASRLARLVQPHSPAECGQFWPDTPGCVRPKLPALGSMLPVPDRWMV